MKRLLAFYGHFAAAFGTCCIVIWLVALIAWVHIDLGHCAFIVIPLASLVYAILRLVSEEELDEVKAAEARIANVEDQAADGQKGDSQHGTGGDDPTR